MSSSNLTGIFITKTISNKTPEFRPLESKDIELNIVEVPGYIPIIANRIDSDGFQPLAINSISMSSSICTVGLTNASNSNISQVTFVVEIIYIRYGFILFQ